jgi:hypothetical protein
MTSDCRFPVYPQAANLLPQSFQAPKQQRQTLKQIANTLARPIDTASMRYAAILVRIVHDTEKETETRHE